MTNLFLPVFVRHLFTLMQKLTGPFTCRFSAGDHNCLLICTCANYLTGHIHSQHRLIYSCRKSLTLTLPPKSRIYHCLLLQMPVASGGSGLAEWSRWRACVRVCSDQKKVFLAVLAAHVVYTSTHAAGNTVIQLSALHEQDHSGRTHLAPPPSQPDSELSVYGSWFTLNITQR